MHKMIQTTQLIFQSRVHNNLLTDGIGLVGIDVPQTHCHRTARGCSPVNACSCNAICGYIKLEPGSVNMNKGLVYLQHNEYLPS